MRISRLEVHADRAWAILSLVCRWSLGGNQTKGKLRMVTRLFSKQIKTKKAMKKTILLLTFVCITITSFAQESNEHLMFKGIPIDGTLNSFVAKLKQKGFTHITTSDGVAMLSGDFAAYKDCTVGAVSLKNKDLVCKVAVIFPSCDTWSALENNYLSLKQMLTKKYGEPSDCVETFQSYSQPKDDGQKMYELKFDRCKYYTIFETEKGNIELQLAHQNVTECYVVLSYFDAINQQAVMSDAMDDL